MRYLKKYILILVIIVVSIVAAVGVLINGSNEKQQEENTELKVIRVSEVTRSLFYAPQYVAINKGFFEANGLKLDLVTGGGADTVMTALLSGQIDIGFCGPEAAVYVYNEGKEDYPEVFAGLTKKDGSFLVGKIEEPDFKWSNLKGKTIIPGRKGGVPYMTLEYVIKQNGMNPSTEMVLDDSIKYDLMAGAFASGEAEYVTLFEPTASLTQKAGKGYIVASVGEASGEIAYTAYMAKKSYIKANEDIIQKFVNSIYEGQRWVKEHSAREIAEAISSFFPDTEMEILETALQKYIDIEAWNDTPILKKGSFDLLQTVIEEAGELEVKAPYEKIVNNKYAEKAVK